MKTKKGLILITVCFFTFITSCSTYRTGIIKLNENITKTQYRSFPEYQSVKKQWERVFKKRGGYFCADCLLFEKFR